MSELKKNLPCVSFTGMPGAGKTTLGKSLAQSLGWTFMDTDNVIEALYARRLQDITDVFGKSGFLEIEGQIIEHLDASRCVIATGGSVIYSPGAVKRLKDLGPLIFLETPFEEIERRVRENPERGIAIEPGQTLFELYEERKRLYEENSDLRVNTYNRSIDECVKEIRNFLEMLPGVGLKPRQMQGSF